MTGMAASERSDLAKRLDEEKKQAEAAAQEAQERVKILRLAQREVAATAQEVRRIIGGKRLHVFGGYTTPRRRMSSQAEVVHHLRTRSMAVDHDGDGPAVVVSVATVLSAPFDVSTREFDTDQPATGGGEAKGDRGGGEGGSCDADPPQRFA